MMMMMMIGGERTNTYYSFTLHMQTAELGTNVVLKVKARTLNREYTNGPDVNHHPTNQLSPKAAQALRTQLTNYALLTVSWSRALKRLR